MKIFGAIFEDHDKIAIAKSKEFKNQTWLLGIWIGIAAVFVFAISVSFPNYLNAHIKGIILPFVEVLLVFISFRLLAKKANPKKREFLKYRHIAEYLRLNCIYSRLGLPINKNRHVYENEKDIHENHSSISGKINRITCFFLNSQKKEVESDSNFYRIPDEIKDLENRYEPHKVPLKVLKFGLSTFIDKQAGYHNDMMIEKANSEELKLECRLKWILNTFLLTVGLKLVLEIGEYFDCEFVHHNEYLLGICKFLIILLPPVYAALEGIAFFEEWKRNRKTSQEVNLNYLDINDRIMKANDRDKLEELAKEFEDAFWNEQLNWLKWYDGKKIEARV